MLNSTLGGYSRKVLRVNLTQGTAATENIDVSFCRKYLGGAGFVAYYLLQEIKSAIDPLSPQNILVFALGPLTGIALPGSGRHCVGSLSPLTGGLAKSEVGGFWGAELKKAGFDTVVIEGKSSMPVYISIIDEKAEIRDASSLWGQNTKETEAAIRDELQDNRTQVALIGPAGEKLVRYSCIMHGLKDAAGRGGLGAVMGSKNLKAIAVRGMKRPNVVNPDGVKALREWYIKNQNKTARLREFGTGAKMEGFEKIGNLPVRNFQDGLFPGVTKISAQTVKDTIRVGMEGCFACPVRCKKVIEIKEPYLVDRAYGGPEYETLAAFGSNCGIDDLFAISQASALCNAYSLDTISTGGVIAFAMECFEKGLWTKKDTDGIELEFGNAEAMLEMIERIARRDGIGDLLAEGTIRAAEKIGNGAEAFAMQVKKMEIPMHEPRLNKAGALGYMINPQGADHCTNLIDHQYASPADPRMITVADAIPQGASTVPFDDLGRRKVELLKFVHLSKTLFDSLTLCQLIPYSLEQIADVTSAVTGQQTSATDLLKSAERTLTMCRLINLKQGFSEKDDKLPARFFGPPRDGALSDKALDFEELDIARKRYYLLMGWDEKGVPTTDKLEELGIS